MANVQHRILPGLFKYSLFCHICTNQKNIGNYLKIILQKECFPKQKPTFPVWET